MALHERVTEKVWLTQEQKDEYESKIGSIRDYDAKLIAESADYHHTEQARQNWLNEWFPKSRRPRI